VEVGRITIYATEGLRHSCQLPKYEVLYTNPVTAVINQDFRAQLTSLCQISQPSSPIDFVEFMSVFRYHKITI
jgi:hypothetical protein